MSPAEAALEQELEDLRPRAFSIAYRMLGSVAEAEDIVQEALMRFVDSREQEDEITSPRAWIATVVTRLSIDELRSARVRRETYVGDWLPEPVVSDPLHIAAPSPMPADEAETADSLSFAFLVLLEKLTPEQRAAFLLHDVFGYEFAEVAEILGKSPGNARQIAVRARRQVDEGRPRFEPTREQRTELVDRFIAAARDGEVAALEAMLAEDVALQGDGGGKVPALARAIHGRRRVARTMGAWVKAAKRWGGVFYREAEVNGQPGALAVDSDGKIIGALAIEVAEGKIQKLSSVVNPEKLAHLGELSDFGTRLGRSGLRPPSPSPSPLGKEESGSSR